MSVCSEFGVHAALSQCEAVTAQLASHASHCIDRDVGSGADGGHVLGVAPRARRRRQPPSISQLSPRCSQDQIASRFLSHSAVYGFSGPRVVREIAAGANQLLALEALGLPSRLMVDCSHGNSNKDYRRQSDVAARVAEQVAGGSRHVMGVMLESHLVAGNQKISPDRLGQRRATGLAGLQNNDPPL